MLDFLYRLPIARSSDVVSSLVSSVRPVGASRSFYPVVSLLARIVLIRLVGRLVPHLVLSSRLACSFRSSHLRFPWGVSFCSVPPSLRLVVSSCRGVLLARLVSFPFTFLIALRIWIGRSCGVGRIIPMSMRLVPLLLVSSLIVRFVAMMRYPFPSCVIRSCGDEDDKAWGERRDELNKTARPQDGRQSVRHIGQDGNGTRNETIGEMT